MDTADTSAKNGLSIRPAAKNDLPAIMKIYDIAQDRMAANGNPDQWGKIYPSETVIKEDIASERCFVVVSDAVHGVFVLCEGEDPTYKTIDGAWLNDSSYVTLHRIAADTEVCGVFDLIAGYCKARYDNIRIDTHEKNTVMQHLIEKNGFARCGIIITHNGTPRIAYHWVRPAADASYIDFQAVLPVINTTLCYIEKDGSWLLQYRNSKPQDVNKGKWIGVGGKFEPGETAEACLVREVFEETGIHLRNYTFLGVIEFRPDDWPAEDMYLFKASVSDKDCPEGLTEPGFCSEGLLEWVPSDEVLSRPTWQGDPYFLRPLLAGKDRIDLRLEYHGDELLKVTDLNEKE